ncbi:MULTISPECIES: RdgB/HAM1 family non-canonical purine NTP pyrophosphatase [unclassified Roseitalea]|uniref:RdgB/HAM1 family non-canonical purine NTP pyrophosphatase n=1 Tax=unclassified Roseitalea TaxID=2639107 RepID=UPI00273EC319|nr:MULTISPECIES: RdgB/HAM1 family non-canonical purine NTP pyrophosphatase [unclassified Roseitalea]
MTRRLEPGRLVLATHNDGKLREIRGLIGPFGFDVLSAGELGLPEPEEHGTTFEENARTKAMAAMQATGLPALADDSGICVDALEGAPGVHTADWAETGNGRDFMMAMRTVEERLRALGATDPAERRAAFVAVLCLAWPDGHCEFFRGEAPGHLIWPPRGDLGFGYDPVFVPDGHDRTFGEMSAAEKHGWTPGDAEALSHRARAFKLFAHDCLGVT